MTGVVNSGGALLDETDGSAQQQDSLPLVYAYLSISQFLSHSHFSPAYP
jgi:hypothetical protein